MSRFACWSPPAFAPTTPDRCRPRDHHYLYVGIGYTTADNPSRVGEQNRSFEMAVDGDWNITMSTPMGERTATLSLKADGGTLTGIQAAEGNSAEIFDGTASGDNVAWKVSITNPMPLTLEFTGKVAGDNMTGEMGIGPRGSFPFTGMRA